MREIVFIILLVGSIGSALWIGDRTSKYVASALTIAALATWLLPTSINERFAHVSVGLFAIDTATWIALLGITACSEKHWPSWIAAMQGMAVLSHLARLGPSIKPLIYFSGTIAWSWTMVILLLAAVLADWPPIRQRLSHFLPILSAP